MMIHREDVVDDTFSLVDRSHAYRVGFRGRAVKALLSEAGYAPSRDVLTANVSEQSLILHLPQDEYWVLMADAAVERLPLQMQTDCYDVFCQDTHAWFDLKAAFKVDMLAKLCAVDLSDKAFPNYAIVHTVIAGGKTLIVHHDETFSLLCDRVVAHGLWAALLDASAEYLS